MQYHSCLFKVLYSQIHRLVKAQSLIPHPPSGSLFPPRFSLSLIIIDFLLLELI